MQKNKTKKRIIHVALQEFARNSKVSMDQIAETADVGRATLYRYFQSRELLMRELMLESQREFNKVISTVLDKDISSDQKLAEAVEKLVAIGASFQFLMNEPYDPGDTEAKEMFDESMKMWRRLIAELKSDDILVPHISDAWMALSLDALIIAAWGGIYKGDIAPNEAPRLVLDSLLKGVGKTKSYI